MNKLHLTRLIILPALLAAGIATTSPVVKAADAPDSEQVSKLLSDAKTQAYQLKEDAATMQSYTQSKVGWESHAETVNQMRDHINAVGRTVTKLDEARATASPWQATAIDRIKPLLKEIASNTDSVIQYLNKNPKRLSMNEYKDYIEANSDEAAQLAELIADFVSYGNNKNRMERLANKLELPGM